MIFDLDGTLADTSADLIAAANYCFSSLGFGAQLDEDGDRLTAFHGGRAMLRLGFSRQEGEVSEEIIDREYDRLIEFYSENINVKTELYPGVLKALDELLSAGFGLGVCTNKPTALADDLLGKLGVRGKFASLVGAGSLSVRKPDPAPYLTCVAQVGGDLTRSYLLGDTETDVKTARAAGVPVSLVTFGPEGEGVAKFQPDALLSSFDELGTVTRQLIG